jgi:tellurite resistance protein TehA-like permease
MPTFFWGGVIIALVIVISVLNSFAWFGSVWWQMNWVSVVWIVVLIAILAPLFVTPKTDDEKKIEEANFKLPFDKVR